jgi:hypothetical protein
MRRRQDGQPKARALHARPAQPEPKVGWLAGQGAFMTSAFTTVATRLGCCPFC